MKAVVSFALAVCVLSTFGQAPPAKADAKKAIQRQYSRWSRAYVGHDVTTLLAILHPNFTLTTASGKTIKRDAYEKILRNRPDKPSGDVYQATMKSFRLDGRRATVISEELSVESSPDKRAPGRSVRTRHIHSYRDVWAMTGSTWKLLSSKTISEK
jgi:hypothetical protein